MIAALNTPAAVAARLRVALPQAASFAPRCYTDADNRIDEARVEAVALRWWAPQGEAHAVRRGTLDGHRAAVRRLAEQEAHRFATHPLAAAIDAVDQAIRDRQADPDSVTREAAILAAHEGRPALLTRGRGNQAAALAVDAVHLGGDLVDVIVERALTAIGNLDRPRAVLVAYHAGRVLPHVVSANRAGADLIEEAEWRVAEMGAVPRFRQAAE